MANNDSALIIAALLVLLVLMFVWTSHRFFFHFRAWRDSKRDPPSAISTKSTPSGRSDIGGPGIILSGFDNNRKKIWLYFPQSDLDRASDRGLAIGREYSLTDLAFNDQSISARHARIMFQSGKFELEDLNSTNGTLLDGIRLVPFTPKELHTGASIELGSARFGVQINTR
jgi:pSer/pThr/pTyr-binding forkhead associated (FHA) protein